MESKSFKNYWQFTNQIKDIDLRYSKTDEKYDLKFMQVFVFEMCPKDKIGVLDFLS